MPYRLVVKEQGKETVYRYHQWWFAWVPCRWSIRRMFRHMNAGEHVTVSHWTETGEAVSVRIECV